MVSRIHCEHESEAIAAAEAIDAAGHEVAIITERFVIDDGEGLDYVVATPASRAELAGLLPGNLTVDID